MIRFFPSTTQHRETLLLGVLCMFCLVLFCLRVLATHGLTFLFLNWNLFLAFVPWALTRWIRSRFHAQTHWSVLAIALGVWLLFFPNAPYLLTDLIHLRHSQSQTLWFDLVLILCYAWTGLLFGFISLWEIESMLSERLPSKYVVITSLSLLFLCSFGIYLGRFLRWNSWDVMSQPWQLLYDIGHRMAHPTQHKRTWGVTMTMFLFLNFIYWTFRTLSSQRTQASA